MRKHPQTHRSMIFVTGVALVAAACNDSVPFGPSDDRALAATAAGTSTPLAVPAGARADTVAIGATKQLVAYSAEGAAIDEGTRRSPGLRWTSSHPDVATVDGNGLATAAAPGVSRVVARHGQRVLDTLWVVVPAPALAAVPAPAPAPAPAPPADTATPPSAPIGSAAELPRVRLNSAFVAPTGLTIRVSSGGDLQAALNSARFGDEIVLSAGAEFVGNFVLPYKGESTQWITVRSSGTLPAEGTRVTPANAGAMARILTPNAAAAIRTAPGTQGWRLVGLEVSATPAVQMNYGLVTLGDASSEQGTLASVPSRIVVDRSYIHGTSTLQLRRCLALNSAATSIVESHFGDCHQNGFDSQAIWGWNGPGPFKIYNNYLEAGHEVVGFGGPTPSIRGLVPSDIEIRRNHITRPLSWRGVWQVKNLFELKSGMRILFEGNVAENNWADAQNGFMIVFQTLTDDNTAPWVRVQDITIRHNVFRNSDQGINLLSRVAYGTNALMPTEGTRRISIVNNVMSNTRGRMFQLLGDLQDVEITRNTVFGESSIVMFDGAPQTGLRVTQNVFTRTQYGVSGSGTGEGIASLTKYAPGADFSANVAVGAPSHVYPTGNAFPAAVGDLNFVNPAAGDYRIGSSQYAYVAGRPVGVDMAQVNAMTSGVVR